MPKEVRQRASTACRLLLEYAFDVRSNRVSIWQRGVKSGGQMVATTRALFGAAFGCVVFCATAAYAQTGLPPQGRPVTAKAISGKKICWKRRYWGLYAANGDFSNDRRPKPHSKWSVPEPGLIKTGQATGGSRSYPTVDFFPPTSAADVARLQGRAHSGEQCVTVLFSIS